MPADGATVCLTTLVHLPCMRQVNSVTMTFDLHETSTSGILQEQVEQYFTNLDSLYSLSDYSAFRTQASSGTATLMLHRFIDKWYREVM